LLLLAALCGEHLLLLGPPGTAKSELVRAAPSSFPVDVLLLLTWPRGAARRAAG
jgi:MoxR-like ATPase